MKSFTLCAVFFLWGAVLFAKEPSSGASAQPLLNWKLFWSGSWEENQSSNNTGTLHNRGEIRLNFLQSGLILRGEVLGRHTLNFEPDSPWSDPQKGIINFNGGLYHRTTGSRLLAGVLDEWGLSARIRNPWIRSPPYAENHRPLRADIKTAASNTKKEEVYLYLSSPFLNLYQDTKLRGFISAQTELEELKPALSGGLDLGFGKKTGLLLEVFYTGAELPPSKSNTWFSNPPPLPEREFSLYAMGIRFNKPDFSVSSDWAYSETFAWGSDIYGNFGLCITPALPFGARERPLSLSFAVDGAGERFTYRDGVTSREGFRCAGKVEWKGPRNALFRINSVLRGPEFGEGFNRSSTNIFYRFPAGNANNSLPVWFTRISLTADRNAENLQKINDGLYGNIGFNVKLPKVLNTGALGINLSGSIKGLTISDGIPSPYPIPEKPWGFDTARGACELTWSPGRYQFGTKLGYTEYEKKDGSWDFSANMAARFRQGRFSLKAALPKSPGNWNLSISWRLEK